MQKETKNFEMYPYVDDYKLTKKKYLEVIFAGK